MDTWDEFGSWEADTSYNQPAVSDMAVTDVMQGTQAPTTGSDQWTGFFQDVVKGAIGYATAKDSAETRAGIAQGQKQAAYRPAYQSAPGTINLGGLMPFLLIGGLILILKD